jgi:protein involved in ribonucleotide reduction
VNQRFYSSDTGNGKRFKKYAPRTVLFALPTQKRNITEHRQFSTISVRFPYILLMVCVLMIFDD